MLDMYASGTFAIDATDPRNQFNERALHEARIATEYREYAADRVAGTSLIARLRAAIAGRDLEPATQACPCPA